MQIAGDDFDSKYMWIYTSKFRLTEKSCWPIFLLCLWDVESRIEDEVNEFSRMKNLLEDKHEKAIIALWGIFVWANWISRLFIKSASVF